MKPLRNLPLEQRWNVLESIVEYATTGQMPKSLDLLETIAFAFIRNEIDRMNHFRTEKHERKSHANDANACKVMQEDAPFDIISVSESVPESKSESEKKSSTTCVCACEGDASNRIFWPGVLGVAATEFLADFEISRCPKSCHVLRQLNWFEPWRQELHQQLIAPSIRSKPFAFARLPAGGGEIHGRCNGLVSPQTAVVSSMDERSADSISGIRQSFIRDSVAFVQRR